MRWHHHGWWWVLSPMINILIDSCKEENCHRDKERKATWSPWKRMDWCAYALIHVQESQRLPGASRAEKKAQHRFFLGAHRRNPRCQHLDLGLLASSGLREQEIEVKCLCWLVMAAPKTSSTAHYTESAAANSHFQRLVVGVASASGTACLRSVFPEQFQGYWWPPLGYKDLPSILHKCEGY